jgi:hypothetical protein
MQAGYYATTDTKVAATLCTVGARPRQQDPISRVVQKGRETWHYWFELDGANGVPTARIVQAILDGQEACEELRANCLTSRAPAPASTTARSSSTSATTNADAWSW